ncbi:MAG TPA: hypothetical protein VHK28_09870, partial [Candidatus Limnocylindria bacterium]|nr:hypothetical protein [Candidatus Limnocylindria bacterium]
MPETSFFECGRCGSKTFLGWSTLLGHYCVGCRRYTCQDCWDTTASCCLDCRPHINSRRPGIPSARRALHQLTRARARLSVLSTGVGGNRAAEQEVLETERRLLAVKSADLSSWIRLAVSDAPQPDDPQSTRILQATDTELAAVEALLAEAEDRSRTRRSRRHGGPGGLDRRWAIALVPVGLLAAWVASSLLGGSMPAGVARESPIASTTTESEVAGGTPAVPRADDGHPPQGSPRVAEAIHLRFDEIITDAPPTDVEFAQAEAVVVPFPNAVDRSVRLTGSGGSGATLCLPVGSRPWTFASV